MYCDPPDSGWGTCYYCGEEGHTVVNCTAVKPNKPRFVLGNLEHSEKQGPMAHDYLICKNGGHHAKDCQEKNSCGSKSSAICLKCGNYGHDMITCKNDYSLDDLKEIQCYICKKFGHLCCVYSDDAMPREASCYKCGQLGHTGLACSNLHGEATGSVMHSSYYNCDKEGYSAKATRASTRSCYKCGEEGHFSWECTNYTKVGK